MSGQEHEGLLRPQDPRHPRRDQVKAGGPREEREEHSQGKGSRYNVSKSWPRDKEKFPGRCQEPPSPPTSRPQR